MYIISFKNNNKKKLYVKYNIENSSSYINLDFTKRKVLPFFVLTLNFKECVTDLFIFYRSILCGRKSDP